MGGLIVKALDGQSPMVLGQPNATLIIIGLSATRITTLFVQCSQNLCSHHPSPDGLHTQWVSMVMVACVIVRR